MPEFFGWMCSRVFAFCGKRTLITGGTGFIGGRLAERLALEEGAHVRVLVRHWHRAVWVSRYAVELVPGDVLDRNSLEAAMDGCAFVFHCASGTEGGGYFRTNVEGTRNILEIAKQCQVQRVIHLSSVAVHGPNPPDNADERAPFVRVGRDYSDSKVAAEELLWDIQRRTSFPVTVIRPTYVWGPRSALFTVRQLREMAQGSFCWIDQGRGACHAVYVDNLVDAILLAALSDEAVGEAFLVSDGLEITWADFFGHYLDLLGIQRAPSRSSNLTTVCALARYKGCLDELQERLKPNPAPLARRVLRRLVLVQRRILEKWRIPNFWDLEKYSRRGRLNISKARRLLRYEPRYDLATGMKETLSWVRDQMGWELGLEDKR